MRRPVGYGIDFGTTNSSISIGYDDGHVELISFNERGPQPHAMPSLVYVDRHGQRSAGQRAIQEYLVTASTRTRCSHCPLVSTRPDGLQSSDCRSFRSNGGCSDSRLLAGLKSELANERFSSTHSWAEDFELEDLVAIALGYLKEVADRASGEEIDRVVLGHPVAFIGATGPDFERLQEKAMARLDSAARRAGFDDVALVPEPAAALANEDLPDGMSIAVDFGGGTFDVAVVEVVDGEAEVLSLQGAAVGGTDLDGALFDLKVAAALGLDDRIERRRRVVRYPAALRRGLRTLSGARTLMNDPQLHFTLQSLERAGLHVQPVRSIVHGGLAFPFYGEVERTKIELSDEERSQINFVRKGAIAVIEDVSRSEFEGAITPMLRTIEEQIARALTQAGTDGQQIRAVVRTGGSSLLPSFNSMLMRLFPSSDIRRRPAFTSVAAGLGAIACQEWGNG